MNQHKTNSYIDKMYCIYNNKCTKCKKKDCRCGKTLFGENTINVYTSKIPPRVDFSYINSLYPSNYPYVYYYGSYENKLLNYC